MGKIVVTEFISLDGVIESPGPAEDYKHAGWTFDFDRGEEGNQFKVDELFEAEANCSAGSPTTGSRRRGRRWRAWASSARR